MPPRVGLVGSICFHQWDSRVTVDDVRGYANALIDARRSLGHPFVLISIFPADFEIPPHAVRLEVIRLGPVVDQLCESHTGVIPGDSPGRVLIRGTLSIMSALLRKPQTFASTVEEALVAPCRGRGLDPREVLAEARARGLIDSRPWGPISSDVSL